MSGALKSFVPHPRSAPDGQIEARGVELAGRSVVEGIDGPLRDRGDRLPLQLMTADQPE